MDHDLLEDGPIWVKRPWKEQGSAERAGDVTLINPTVQAVPMKHMVTIGQLPNFVAPLDAIQADGARGVCLQMTMIIMMSNITMNIHMMAKFYNLKPLLDECDYNVDRD